MLIKSMQQHLIEFKQEEKSDRKFLLSCPIDATFAELYDIGNALREESWKRMDEMKKKQDEQEKKKVEEPKVEELKN